MSNIETGGPAFPTEVWDAEGIPQHTEGMTLRQYAAIKLRVPNSGTDWLDDMIRESLRDEFAAKAMQGYLASCATDFEPAEFASTIAKDAYVLADAMLEARQS